MELPITPMLLTHPVSRPALRPQGNYLIRQVKAIVVHWTANERRGADADNNRNYFNLGSRPASAHYIVDDRTIIQCIPDHEVAFHCGDRPERRYRPAGRELIKGTRLTPNYFTIGVEMCVNADADWDKTYRHTCQLVALLMLRHNLPAGSVQRHWDITGKPCPAPLLLQQDWQQFVDHVHAEYLELKSIPIGAVTGAPELNVRTGPGVQHPIKYALREGYRVPVFQISPNGWCRIGVGEWVSGKFIQ